MFHQLTTAMQTAITQLYGVTPELLEEMIARAVIAANAQKHAADAKNTWLSRTETAQMLAISLTSLDKLVSDKKIRSTTIGRKRRFRISDIEAYLQSRLK